MSNLALLASVARSLGPVRDRVTFVGGAVRGLLITDSAAPPERPTDDVDLIVELTSQVELFQLGTDLRANGWREDTSPNAPICRWVAGGIKVDVMPTDSVLLGFSNAWYRQAIASAIDHQVEDQSIRVVNAPCFCATKVEAFRGRGGGDFFHHDVEDIVAVVDGRDELIAEVDAAPADLRAFIAQAVAGLLQQEAFLEALPGHLAGDSGSQARLPLLKRRLQALSALAPSGK